MGLFDMFSKKPTPKKIDKLTKRMLNEHQQQQVRQEAIAELVSFGTVEAIAALVKRLGMNFRDTIKNEADKRQVSDILVDHFAAEAIQPLLSFIRTEQKISAVIMTLGRVVGPERLVTELIQVLEQYAPSDHSTMDARLQLVDALADHDDERVVPAVTPYLADHDDDVRIKVMGLVEDRVGPKHDSVPHVVEGLMNVLTDPMASGRIVRRAATVLAKLKVDLSLRKDEFIEFLPEGVQMAKNGRLTVR
jgi:HEAT repeat protein